MTKELELLVEESELCHEKRLLLEEYKEAVAWQIRNMGYVPYWQIENNKSRLKRIARRLSWLNTEIWLVQNAQPSSGIR